MKIAKEFSPSLNADEISTFEYYIHRDSRGLGPLQPLIDDPFLNIISINGPDKKVNVQHLQYGPLITSTSLNEDEIHNILVKICNRSVSPVEITNLPLKIILRSGLVVNVSKSDNGFSPSILIIRKPPSLITNDRQDIQENHSDQILSTYHLYHDMVVVRVIGSSDNEILYQISMIDLSPEEKSAITEVKEEKKRKPRLQSFREGAFRITADEFSRLLSQKFPDIPKDRYHLLYVVFTFSQDTAKWIRVILADHEVLRILCTHPGKPVRVWHTEAPKGADTSVIPDQTDLNRIADFFIKSTGKEIDPNKPELTIKYRNGWKAILTRVIDNQGHYYRIDVRKKETKNDRSEKSLIKTRNQLSADKKPPSSDNCPDPRIEDLLTKIFDLEPKNKPDSPVDSVDDDESPDVRTGFSDRLLRPIKSGIKGLTHPGSRKKEKLSLDEAPIPDIMQVSSVINFQNEEDGCIAEEAYWLFQPHAYVVILKDSSKEITYRVIEPDLSPGERIILEETHETLRDVLVYDKPVTKGNLFLEFDEVAKVVRSYDPRISDDRLSVLYYYLRRNLNGYGKIDALMYDELLEDISCNGHNLPVFIHHRYYGSIPTSVKFESEELNRFVLKLSQKADKQVSLTSPLLDASLPNGARAQITYSNVVSTKGSSFTIRKFRSDPMTPATLLAFGTYSNELLAFIWLALENRQSLIVVGGTASGKTSTMNAFSFFIPHNSKIVSLEDTREIQIPQKNWLPVQTRDSNSFTDRGSVNLFDLLKASLRQRPEYIIVGEVRGSEAQTLFQAMNSGHTTLSTLHAGNIEEALNRLINEPINVPPAMFSALNLMVIQTFHYRGGRMIRRCDAIHEIVLGEGDRVNWNTLFEYEPTNDSFRKAYTESKTLQTIRYMHNWTEKEIQYQLDLRAGFLARIRNQYSTDPDILIKMITDLRRLA